MKARWTRGRVVDRLVALLELARTGRRLDVDALAEKHGVCRRTIVRDLEAIERVRPVDWRVYPNGYAPGVVRQRTETRV